MSVVKNSNGAPPAAGGSGSLKRKACAACRHQRNRCGEDCDFAPYFPAECHEQFLKAENLYGVANMRSMLKRLNPIHHSVAMKAIKFESDAHARDPVGGCRRIILQFIALCQSLESELHLLKRELASYCSHADSPNNNDYGGMNENANDRVAAVSRIWDPQQLQDQDDQPFLGTFPPIPDPGASDNAVINTYQDQPQILDSSPNADAGRDGAVINNFLNGAADALDASNGSYAASDLLNEDNANYILDTDVILDYNGNEAAPLGHQSIANITDHSVNENANHSVAAVSSICDPQQLQDQDEQPFLGSFPPIPDPGASDDAVINNYQDRPQILGAFSHNADAGSDGAANNAVDALDAIFFNDGYAASDFLNDDDANYNLGTDVTSDYNGNEATLLGHQSSANITDESVCLVPGDDYWL